MKKLLPLICLLIFAGCQQQQNGSGYLRWIGDAVADPVLDSEEFQLCYDEKRVMQYFNFSSGLQYEGEKKALVRRFNETYVAPQSTQSGWIRIRFIVNCQGEAGRFRLISSDENYQEQAFDSVITDQLLTITKSLDGWSSQPIDKKPKDYYQYLVFKIKNGVITEILP